MKGLCNRQILVKIQIVNNITELKEVNSLEGAS